MPEAALVARLAAIRTVVEQRRAIGGWPVPPRIVAVTKTHGPAMVAYAVAVGLDAVGENRVQEALDKQAACAGLAVEWHLIGTLQKNKARHLPGRFALIHSVDRSDLAEELDRRVPADGSQAILIQVNCSNEPQKGGVDPADLMGFLDRLRDRRKLVLRGLMTMAAFSAPEREVRRTFSDLRRLRDRASEAGHHLPELSMGMSDDYPIAVEEGATLLRLGTALFGSRP